MNTEEKQPEQSATCVVEAEKKLKISRATVAPEKKNGVNR